MTWVNQIRSWWRSVVKRGAVEREMESELRFHMESYAEDLVKHGASPEEAKRQARIEFGSIEAKKEECRSSLGLRLWDELRSDVRYAFRALRKSPGFAVVAMVTLALGIGVNTAIFTMVNGVLLRPLPYPEPDRLVAINEYNSDRPVPEIPQGQLSYPNFEDVASRSHSFESVAAYTFMESTVTGTGTAFRVKGQRVSPEIFRVLGVQPQLGRAFIAGEDGPGHHVVIISDRLWRTHFGTDPAILGRAVTLDGSSYTIVGVMPPGFQFAPRSKPSDVWLTFSRWSEIGITSERGNHSIFGLGRLKRGVAVSAANAELTLLARALATAHPDKNRHTGIAAVPELTYMVGNTKTELWVLMGAVALVLLIACANIANLLLARGAARAREIAVRAALGAIRLRIVRQLVTESLVLSFAGAALGTAVGVFAVKGLLKMYPENLPRAAEIAIDVRVLMFTATIALATGVLFGLIPAWRVSAPNLTAAMHQSEARSTAGPGHNRVRGLLVITETALGMMLLVGAGLLIRSFQRLSHVDLGFDPSHVVTADFDISRGRYTNDEMDRLIANFVSRMRSLPGVVSAAGSLPLPLGGNDLWSVGFNVLDHPVPESEYPSASFYMVTGDFFQSLRVPLLRGRLFDDRDQRNSPPVMIITEALAKRYFPDENPIGRKIYMGAGDGRKEYYTREIVGVVGDIRTTNLSRPPGFAFYVPISQMLWGAPTIVVRTHRSAETLGTELTKLLASLDPEAPLYDVRNLEDWLALDLGRARFQAVLLGVFAGLALLMTAVGLYGVIAYTVAQRTQEFGIRMALGASRKSVMVMTLNHGLRLTLAGVALGIAGALALTRAIATLLYNVPPHDATTYVAVCIVLAAVALLASYVPAQRATRVDPIIALRYE